MMKHFCIASACLVVFWPVAKAQVVISELLWVGSQQSSADEWVELQVLPTFTGSYVSVSNWQLMTLDSKGEPKLIYKFASGAILPAVRPYLIANFSATDSHLVIEPDIVTTDVSLLNAKLLVWLQDAAGTIIDQVDDGVGAPFAGGKIGEPTAYVSMERISLVGSGALKTNWRSAEYSYNIISGSTVIGTPGFVPVYNSSGSSQQSQASSVVQSSVSSTGSLASSSLVSSASGSTATGVHIPWEYTQLFIAELLPNPIGSDDAEWIKLGFSGTGSINVNGVSLADLSGKTYVIQSGAVLHSGGTLAFTKDATGITLNNTTDTVTLSYAGVVLDVFTYENLPEGIGASKNSSGTVIPVCAPSLQDGPQTVTPLLQIELQSTTGVYTASGVLAQTGSVQLNVQLVTSGSLTNSTCQVTTSDGWQSNSCNPPSHTITTVGSGILTAAVTNYCGTTAVQIIKYIVYNKENSSSNTVQNNPANQSNNSACMPSIVSGIFITEVLPNPVLAEVEGEWIELHNPNNFRADMCGWQLDDIADGGSKPFALDNISIAANGYVVLNRPLTGIALNNSNESVRLLAPIGLIPDSPVKEVQKISYEKAAAGMSYAVRTQNEWLWTPFVTPGVANKFKTNQRSFMTNGIMISAVLPNPDGTDTPKAEWIELTNPTDVQQKLEGQWALVVQNGKHFTFNSIVLEPREVRRIHGGISGLQLTNASGEVQLQDPEGYIHSVLSWQNAATNTIYRASLPQGAKINAQVVDILTDNTLLIRVISPDELTLLPPSVQRVWSMEANYANPVLRVQLLGAQMLPNTLSTMAHLKGTSVLLQFGSPLWQDDTTALAYMYTNAGLLQSLLLQSGQAAASSRYTHVLHNLFAALEAEANHAKLGVWSQPEQSLQLLSLKETTAIDAFVAEKGLAVGLSINSGLIESGAVLQITPSAPSLLYVSVNSGAYQLYNGALLLQNTLSIQAYAQRVITGSGNQLITSAIVTGDYIVKQSSYSTDVFISEVYPSPRPGKQEWVELYNAGTKSVDLSGWQLDDVLIGGSKAYNLPIGSIIQPKSTLVVPRSLTSIAFNNSGDEAWLLTPTGQEISGVQYASVPTEQSVMLTGAMLAYVQTGCRSAIPTPHTFTNCIVLPPKAQLPDTDNDLVPDVYETMVHKTDKLLPDTDGDGWLDGFEVELGEDVPPVNVSTRQTRLQYKQFMAKHTSARFKLLKTKPSRLYGKAAGIKRVQVAISAANLLLEPQILSGTWQAELPQLASGSYLATITFTDVAGMQFAQLVPFSMPSISTKKATVKKYSLPSWAKFKQLYVTDALSETDATIWQLFAGSKPKNNSTLNSQFIILMVLIVMLVAAMTCLLSKKLLSAIIGRL